MRKATTKVQQQKMLEEDGDENRWTMELFPFKHPITGEGLLAPDTLDTKGMGFVYDDLPSKKPAQMREAPTYALFHDVKVSELTYKSYSVYVFVHDEKEEPFVPDTDTPIDAINDPHFGGLGAIFGGKDRWAPLNATALSPAP